MQEDKAVKLQELRSRVAARMAAKGQSYGRCLTYLEASSPKRLKVRFDWSKVKVFPDSFKLVRFHVEMGIKYYFSGHPRVSEHYINRANYELTGAYDGQDNAFWSQFWEKKS